MAIDFTLAPEHEEIRTRVRSFIQDTVQPRVRGFDDEARVPSRHEYLVTILELREEAKRAGLWLPHMPKEWGGMGLGHVELAMVQAEAGKTRLGPWILNCMAPDEGNMHTLLHWGTDAQKDNYLRRLCEGTAMSCFAMTEPEVAGSDPTLIQTRAEKDGDEWVINGHKWFISNARRAQFAILVARTEPDVPPVARRQHRLPGRPPGRGLERRARGRDDARVDRPLRDRHRGPARPRLADPRWAGQRPPPRAVPAGTGPPGPLHALDRPGRDGARHDGGPVSEPLLPRLTPGREAGRAVAHRRLGHGAVPVQADGPPRRVQDRPRRRLPHRGVDGQALRGQQPQPHHRPVHAGARRTGLLDRHPAGQHAPARPLGPFADGADEIHQMRIAERTIAAYKDTGSTTSATGGLPL